MLLTTLLALTPFAAQNPIDLTLDPNAIAQANMGTGNYISGSVYGGTINAGSIDSDDFNRATLGAGWAQQGSATFTITANMLTSGFGNDWIQRVGTSAPYADQSTEFDLTHNPAGLSYVAAVQGIGADQLFTKVQSNGGGGVYDTMGFYHGFNGGGAGTYGGFFTITPVTGELWLKVVFREL